MFVAFATFYAMEQTQYGSDETLKKIEFVVLSMEQYCVVRSVGNVLVRKVFDMNPLFGDTMGAGSHYGKAIWLWRL